MNVPPHAHIFMLHLSVCVAQVTAPEDAYEKGRLLRDLREEEVSLEFQVQYKDAVG